MLDEEFILTSESDDNVPCPGYMALSINIDQNSWLLTNSVIQIHMEILQHFMHQNYDVIELLISYLMIPSSLLKPDANYMFVNGQLFWCILVESAK